MFVGFSGVVDVRTSTPPALLASLVGGAQVAEATRAPVLLTHFVASFVGGGPAARR